MDAEYGRRREEAEEGQGPEAGASPEGCSEAFSVRWHSYWNVLSRNYHVISLISMNDTAYDEVGFRRLPLGHDGSKPCIEVDQLLPYL